MSLPFLITANFNRNVFVPCIFFCNIFSVYSVRFGSVSMGNSSNDLISGLGIWGFLNIVSFLNCNRIWVATNNYNTKGPQNSGPTNKVRITLFFGFIRVLATENTQCVMHFRRYEEIAGIRWNLSFVTFVAHQKKNESMASFFTSCTQSPDKRSSGQLSFAYGDNGMETI